MILTAKIHRSVRPCVYTMGIYTLRVMQLVCAVKFARRLDVNLELIESKMLNSTIISESFKSLMN